MAPAAAEDRISKLPDELLHLILSFMNDTKFALQTSALSPRWKNVWKFLPRLSFNSFYFHENVKFSEFVDSVFSRRNHPSDVSAVRFTSNWVIDSPLFKNILAYAFSHGVNHLSIAYSGLCHRPGKIPFRIPTSIFSCPSLRYLCLTLDYETPLGIFPSPPLPPSVADRTNFIIAPWNLPNLITLYLHQVHFEISPNCSLKSADFFSNLVNLKDLSLILCVMSDLDTLHIISVSLKNLTICTSSGTCMYVVSAPNLTSFKYEGKLPLLSITEPLNYLSEATIKPWDIGWRGRKVHVKQLNEILRLVRSAVFLTISADTVVLLSASPQLLESRTSPFGNLKILTIEVGNCAPAISNDVIAYFLNSSPNACIETISFSGRRTKLQNC